MFDFSDLKLVKGSKDSFVGIRKSSSSEEFEFCLPNGFEDFPEGNFDEIRNLFFGMYRTFRKFEQDNITTNRFNRNPSHFQRDQDQTTLSPGGVSMQTAEGEVCVLYSKIKMIEQILEAYDDLAINSIQKKVRRSEEINYSQIHRYLDRAVYLENDVVYVESMDLARPIVRYESTELINLYCYILDEIVQQLQEDVPDNIKARLQDIQFFSQHFQDNYLTVNQSIFDKDTFVETVSILKEALDNIDRNTYYKDSDYWQLYEAIETFLYGELNSNQTDGDFWGIKGFSLLWEDMCHTFFFKKYRKEILYADTDISLKNYSNLRRNDREQSRVGNYSTHDGSKHWNQWIYCTISDIPYSKTNGFFGWNELLCIEMDSKPGTLVYTNRQYDDFNARDRSETRFRRFPRPDLILRSLRNPSKVIIVDYKYVPLSFYTNSSLSKKSQQKFREDIIKQLTYEFAIQQTHTISENWFFIPYFYENPPEANPWGEIGFPLKYNGMRVKIDVFKANFLLIQKVYLDENS
ncbi:LlaJI family restriction endonuclease [Oscillatoria sp. FACHB-1406]|uniref:LlaJI family restriction endonuclease n=1 Tax=Oscillatoria sp. FACHB-1406 TaxID=2692846 RepID=UPI0016820441|nr:LlaJI family restriction endonuclease [Oscillatoria sp. FACHB-1406]MBD2578255.1 LlaJI family restriction endonuclease [Oscillatoria sp. FACHB-1406]